MSPASKFIPLSHVPSRCGIPGRFPGRSISFNTVHRWATAGLRNGIRLRTEFMGGTRCTTEEWLSEFFAALNAAAAGKGRATAPKKSEKDAEREMEAVGV